MFEVLTYSLADGWSNNWTTFSDNPDIDDEKPEMFETREEAETSILDEIADTKEAIERGDMDEGAALSISDFKIVEN
ncbi:MAG: hypothetical protein ACYDDE_00595 [bacterium]